MGCLFCFGFFYYYLTKAFCMQLGGTTLVFMTLKRAKCLDQKGREMFAFGQRHMLLERCLEGKLLTRSNI